MAQPTISVATWHPHYDNPQDDIVLITKDNVKFRLSSRLLDKHSTITYVLMPALRDRQAPNEDVKPNLAALDPVHIDATCLLLELFLSMLPETTREFVLNALTFEQCQDLLTFAEQYECVKLIPRIRTYLIHKTTGQGKPTALFLFASDRDDWALGRDAMKKMDADEVRPIFRTVNRGKSNADTKARVFFDKLRVDWQQVLMPLLFFGACALSNKVSQLEWRDFADKFVKPVKSPKRKACDEVASAAKKVRGG